MPLSSSAIAMAGGSLTTPRSLSATQLKRGEGQPLARHLAQRDAGKVKEAREKEVRYVREKAVYAKIPRPMATRRGWKIIRTRWIDITKGDDANPVYRSRLVGNEFINEHMDCIFAGTPPLEAVRFLLHGAATVRSGEERGSKVLMINDVARAFFERYDTDGSCAINAEARFTPCSQPVLPSFCLLPMRPLSAGRFMIVRVCLPTRLPLPRS